MSLPYLFPLSSNDPFYITRRDGLPIAFAGLWENAKELHGTAAIVTTAASEETRQIHDRMPVILERSDFPRWLASQSLTKQEAESSLGHLQVVRYWPGQSVAESITSAMMTLA